MKNPEDKNPDFQEENNLQANSETKAEDNEQMQPLEQLEPQDEDEFADKQSDNHANIPTKAAIDLHFSDVQMNANETTAENQLLADYQTTNQENQADQAGKNNLDLENSIKIKDSNLGQNSDKSLEFNQEQNISDQQIVNSQNLVQQDQIFNELMNQHPDNALDQHLEELDNQTDYSHFSKQELVDLAEKQVINPDFANAEAIIQKIKPIYEHLKNVQRLDASQVLGSQADNEQENEVIIDALDERFELATKAVKERRKKQQADQEKQKTINLADKNLLIQRLTKLVESEEHKSSREELKKIQDSWKSIGPVPLKDADNLWNIYNHLVNKYYNNNTIFNQLKDLDRKKNLEAKLDICQRAENLVTESSINKSLKELNELHEEFRALGPVPKEDQELIWDRFKLASDAIYNRRREYIEAQQSIQVDNEREKLHLIERLDPFLEFTSLRIDDWNAKSKELLELQQEWKKTGPAPKNRNAELSRVFWNSYKQFFSNKSEFFKKLADEKQENLNRKTALIQEAESLSESSDWNTTSARLKELQEQWKTIGPVPFKSKNGSYEQFKSAIDKFFDNRRSQLDGVDKEFKDNMDKKYAICQKLEDYAKNKTGSLSELDALTDEFYSIGHVPGRNLNELRKRFADAITRFLDNSEQIEPADKARSIAMMAINKTDKKAPRNSSQAPKLQDWAIKKNIIQQENEIETLKTNMDFLSSSKNGQALRKQYESKVEEAQKRLDTLKEQLKVIQKNPS